MHLILKKGLFAFVLVSVCILITALHVCGRSPNPDVLPQQGYIRASGDCFYDSDGEVFQIKSIGFGSFCWDNRGIDGYDESMEQCYAELAELGFNAVRFHLDYSMFESDSDPYTYNAEGFSWLDQNLEWAKKYGIRLLFNMHIPQGGYQSLWGGLALWQNQNEEQQRLIALWKAIAQRYADEPAVLGYGLVNEPHLLWLGDAETTIAQWENLAQQITEAIRSADCRHILFLEPAIGAIDPESGQIYYQLNGNSNLITVDDPAGNLACELHFYDPVDFTHFSTEGHDEIWCYPDEDRAVHRGSDLYWACATYAGDLNPDTSYTDGSGWTYVETNWIDPTALDANHMNLSMACNGLGQEDRVYLDDLVVSIRSPEGEQYVLYAEDFSSQGNWYSFWNEAGTGGFAYLPCQGHNGNGCLMIQGPVFYGTLQESDPHYIALREGYEYKVSAWVRVEGDAQQIQVYPQASLYNASSSVSFTRDYLSYALDDYQKAAEAMGCPLFMGEFGLTASTMDYGGDVWVADFLTLCNEKGISYSYHEYRAYHFGLHPVPDFSSEQLNETLYHVFLENVSPSFSPGE